MFAYDVDGTNCLDTINDFIKTKNPEGLSTPDFMNKHWHSVLGMEHTQWTAPSGRPNDLQCGYTAETSCRDLARSAQLWSNDGYWPGAGQLMDKSFAQRGRTWVKGPGSGGVLGVEYGYSAPSAERTPCTTPTPRLRALVLTAPLIVFRASHVARRRRRGGSACLALQRSVRAVRVPLRRAQRGDREHGQRHGVWAGLDERPRCDREPRPPALQRNSPRTQTNRPRRSQQARAAAHSPGHALTPRTATHSAVESGVVASAVLELRSGIIKHWRQFRHRDLVQYNSALVSFGGRSIFRRGTEEVVDA